MIATPIVNPIVLLSTYNAFPTMPQMVAYRAVGGFVGAVLIGLLVGRFEARSVLKEGKWDGKYVTHFTAVYQLLCRGCIRRGLSREGRERG